MYFLMCGLVRRVGGRPDKLELLIWLAYSAQRSCHLELDGRSLAGKVDTAAKAVNQLCSDPDCRGTDERWRRV